MTTASCPVLSLLDLPSARLRRDGLAALLRVERAATADFLLALAEFDQRRGWEPLGHASLFAFLSVELRLSNAAAYWRMSAARLLRRFPDLVEPLRDGRLCLTTVAELSKVLTEENRAEVLPRFYGASSRAAKEVVAELLPREAPPLRSAVTPVERSGPRGRAAIDATPLGSAGRTDGPDGPPRASSLRAPEAEPIPHLRGAVGRDEVVPLTAELRRLHITVSRQFLSKVDAARSGLSHGLPGATIEQVLEAAVDLLLEKQARARGALKRPRAAAGAGPSSAPRGAPLPVPQPAPEPEVRPGLEAALEPAEAPPSRHRAEPREHVPAAVRRAVWARDGGRCAWPLDSGGCCGSTHRLELDHVVPWALGGGNTIANLRVACARHNQFAARRVFGARLLARYLGPAATSPPANPASDAGTSA